MLTQGVVDARGAVCPGEIDDTGNATRIGGYASPRLLSNMNLRTYVALSLVSYNMLDGDGKNEQIFP